MSNYGRNFEFLQSPLPQHRLGRFKLVDALSLPIGVPVKVPSGAVANALGRLDLELATGAQAPQVGVSGIAVYEHSFNWERGVDPVLTNPSDLDTIPAGDPTQLCFGTECKVRLKNTVARTFLGLRSYTGRVMVAGLGATPTVAVGDLLTPGVGTDAAGYWAETATLALAWLRVTFVSATAVEAQLVF